MWVHRNTAAIVSDGETAIFGECHLDPVRMAGNGLVHRVVEHLGEEVMQRLLIGAANIHARPTPHRLQPFQNLNVLGRVTIRLGRACLVRASGRGFARRGRRGGTGGGKQIIGLVRFARLAGGHELGTSWKENQSGL